MEHEKVYVVIQNKRIIQVSGTCVSSNRMLKITFGQNRVTVIVRPIVNGITFMSCKILNNFNEVQMCKEKVADPQIYSVVF